MAHVDVRRMLITMRALTRAARTICYATAVALDRAPLAGDAAARQAGQDRAALLSPVAKAFSTDIGSEVATLGIQVHGGMGFSEETGAGEFIAGLGSAAAWPVAARAQQSAVPVIGVLGTQFGDIVYESFGRSCAKKPRSARCA